MFYYTCYKLLLEPLRIFSLIQLALIFASRELLLELTGNQEKWFSFILQEYSQKVFFSFGLDLGNSLGTLMKSASNKESISGKCGGVNNKRLLFHCLPDL